MSRNSLIDVVLAGYSGDLLSATRADITGKLTVFSMQAISAQQHVEATLWIDGKLRATVYPCEHVVNLKHLSIQFNQSAVVRVQSTVPLHTTVTNKQDVFIIVRCVGKELVR